jgi:transposase-like protein
VDPRIPEEAGGIRINHCRSPNCVNYGVPASIEPVPKGRRPKGAPPEPYTVTGQKAGVPALVCNECKIQVAIKSNEGIYEEIRRVSAYLRPTPVPACGYWRCENSGKSVLLFPDVYQRFGKTAYGTQRYRCKGCGRTCAEPKMRPPTGDQLQAYKNATIFRGILAKAPVRRLLEAADIGAETFYARLRFFERQCLAFAGHRERRRAELDIDRLTSARSTTWPRCAASSSSSCRSGAATRCSSGR